MLKSELSKKLTLIVIMGVSFLFISLSSLQAGEPHSNADSLNVQQIDLKQLQEKIKSNKGKITMINFWASWCDPCKEEMPFLVKLRTNYKDKFDLFIVAIDEADSIHAVILPILQKSGVDFTTYIKQEGDDEGFINAINPKWSGALPATFIYNENGKQIEMMVSGQTYQKFERVLKKYMK